MPSDYRYYGIKPYSFPSRIIPLDDSYCYATCVFILKVISFELTL